MSTPRAERSSHSPAKLRPLPIGKRGPDGNLPSPLTTLIGREDEIASACSLVQRDDVRLVTFTGPGGVGKTQLALAVARKLSDDFADGVVFVPLAAISDPAHVATAIAQALDVRDRGTRSLVDSVKIILRKQEVLLVLDNFEHLLEAAPLVVELLASCPHVKIVVTSRALLHVSGENSFAVPPMDVPDPGRSSSIAELLQYDSVELFVTRAREMNRAFALTNTNAEAVATICRSLDGLPLAIELAAARTRVLSAQALNAQMTDRLPLLTGGRRDAPDRLQTMRQAIAWSFDLLSGPEQILFRQLSVFVGGFTFESARAVVTDQFSLDDLSSLVDKSLVQQTEQADGELRFSMLETIREFGLEQLAASGEREELRRRHAQYFLDFAERADQAPLNETKVIVGKRVEVELPNLRAALAWAEEEPDPELMLRLTLAHWWYWESRGSMEEASDWVDRTIEATEGTPPALRSQRALLFAFGAFGATYKRELERAMMLVDDAANLAREANDARASAMVTQIAGVIAIWRGELDHANTYLQDAFEQLRELGDIQHAASALFYLGWIATLQEKHTTAESRITEATALAQAADWRLGTVFGFEALGNSAREQGDYHRAASLVSKSLSIVQDGSDLMILSNCLKTLGAVAAVTGKAERSARLFGAAEALKDQTGIGEQPEAEKIRLERAYAPARARLSADEFAAAWATGRELPLDHAIAEALDVARELTAVEPLDSEAPPLLTPRELDVLRLLVEGLSDKEIADELGISRRTVSKHVETILSKLGVPSRTAAATFATRHGLV